MPISQVILDLCRHKCVDIQASIICLYTIDLTNEDADISIEMLWQQLSSEQQTEFEQIIRVIHPRENHSSGTLDHYYPQLSLDNDYQTWCCKRNFSSAKKQPRTFYLTKKGESISRVILLSCEDSKHSIQSHFRTITQNFKKLTESGLLTTSYQNPKQSIIDTDVKGEVSELTTSPKSLFAKQLDDLCHTISTQWNNGENYEQPLKVLFDTLINQRGLIAYLKKESKQLRLDYYYPGKRKQHINFSIERELSTCQQDFMRVLGTHAEEESYRRVLMLSFACAPELALARLHEVGLIDDAHAVNALLTAYFQCMPITDAALRELLSLLSGKNDYLTIDNASLLLNRMMHAEAGEIMSHHLDTVKQLFPRCSNADRLALIDVLCARMDKTSLGFVFEHFLDVHFYTVLESFLRHLQFPLSKDTNQFVRECTAKIEKKLEETDYQNQADIYRPLLLCHEAALAKLGLRDKLLKTYLCNAPVSQAEPAHAKQPANRNARNRRAKIAVADSLAPYQRSMSLEAAFDCLYASTFNTLHEVTIPIVQQQRKTSFALVNATKSHFFKGVEAFYRFFCFYMNQDHSDESKAADRQMMLEKLFLRPENGNYTSIFEIIIQSGHVRCAAMIIAALPADHLATLTFLDYVSIIHCKLYAMLDLLLTSGLNPNIDASVNHRSGLVECLLTVDLYNNADHSTAVKMLLQHGADPNIETPYNYVFSEALDDFASVALTPLDIIIISAFQDKSFYKYCYLLLEYGANPNNFFVGPDDFVINAADLALNHGRKKLVGSFAKMGIKPLTGFLPNYARLNPKYYAEAQKMYSEKLAELTENCKNENSEEAIKEYIFKTIEAGYTMESLDALLQCVAFGAIKCADLILKHELANVNRYHPLYGTALHGAVDTNNKDMVALLLEYGADVNSQRRREQRQSPLRPEPGQHVFKGNIHSVNQFDRSVIRDGKTPLHLAAEKNHVEIVDLLLQHGASIYLKDVNNKTPVQLALEKGLKELARSMLDAARGLAP